MDRGSVTQKIEPRGVAASTPTSPCMASARCLTMARPRPVPPSLPRAAGVHAVEALENAVSVMGSEAGAVVRHLDTDVPRLSAPTNGEVPVSEHVLHRVVQEVDDDLIERVGIRLSPEVRRHGEFQREAFGFPFLINDL